MNKMKELSAACTGMALGLVLFLFSNAIRWCAILLHLFTAYILWQVHGITFGVIGLLCPFIAEVYTFIACWVANGFLNYYTLAVAIVVALYLTPFLICWIIATLHKDKQ